MKQESEAKEDRRRWVGEVLALLGVVGAIALSGCGGTGVVVPPVTPVATDTYHTGKFVWYDLLTSDVPATERFYRELFGWDFVEDDADSTYLVITSEGKAIGGVADIARMKMQVNASQWVGWISVPNVDAAVLEIQDLGGVVHSGPDDLPDRGRAAIVGDPQGAVFAILTSNTGDPEDAEPAENQWLWRELLTTDVDGALAFYAQLFDYERETFDAGIQLDYQLLSRDGRRRAGVFENPFEGVRSHWLPYVRVSDPTALIRRVESLGGHVVVAPSADIRDGTVAVIVDPSGAALAIQKWSPER